MKIVFLDHFGCFASVVLAASYSGVLSPKLVKTKDILNLPHFAEVKNIQPGKLYFLGKDQAGNDYYTLGAGFYSSFIINVVWPDLKKLSEIKGRIVLYDVNSLNSFLLIYFEILSQGRFRKITKYFWALWFIHFKRKTIENVTKVDFANHY